MLRQRRVALQVARGAVKDQLAQTGMPVGAIYEEVDSSLEPDRNECIGGRVHAYERRTEASR